MKQNNINQAIFKTLVYSDMFGSPLNFSEIHRYLLQHKISKPELRIALGNVSFLNKKGSYYMLRGREAILADRSMKLRESKRKLQIAKDVVMILNKIPTILLVGVSGSVAVKNAGKGADVDLFVVTRTHSLWITRIFVTLTIHLMQMKRKPGTVLAPDTICTNMWMSENRLTLPKKNLFIAREVAQLYILFNRKDTYSKFLQANSWVVNYFPNITPLTCTYHKPLSTVISQLLWPLNLIAYAIQRLYMKRRRTSENVSLHYAAFHPKDISQLVLQTYTNRIRNFSPQKPKSIPTLPDLEFITPGS